MHVNDLNELVERHENNLKLIVKLQTGVDIDESTPMDLVETLEAKLKESYVSGINYSDVMRIKELLPESTLTLELNPFDYGNVRTFSGLTQYQLVINTALTILKQ